MYDESSLLKMIVDKDRTNILGTKEINKPRKIHHNTTISGLRSNCFIKTQKNGKLLSGNFRGFWVWSLLWSEGEVEDVMFQVEKEKQSTSFHESMAQKSMTQMISDQ